MHLKVSKECKLIFRNRKIMINLLRKGGSTLYGVLKSNLKISEVLYNSDKPR
jgi:hypothetical protein